MSDLQPKLLDMVMAAIELAESVQDDIEEMRSISDDTVIALNNFAMIHAELDQVLDFENYAMSKGRIKQ